MRIHWIIIAAIAVTLVACDDSAKKESVAATTAPTSTATSQQTSQASPPTEAVASATTSARAAAPTRLSGADIFRINCQACHGPTGGGTEKAPSLRGASVAGLDKPLKSGGKKMPAFPHLSQPEINAVVAYAAALAAGGTPPAGGAVVTLSDADLGSRVYFSNCASCHEHGGAKQWGMMCQPASLGGATTRFSKAQVMNLLDTGAGPMPAFKHLTNAERDALWAHLATLPADPDAEPTMGQRCPMIRAAMEGKHMGPPHGRGKMGPGMMRSRMMGGGMNCPMMGSPRKAETAPNAEAPPCCE
ncbi:MAG: c-type cytochrome [Polyangiaceae bacterium]